jgi:hypothetical protein
LFFVLCAHETPQHRRCPQRKSFLRFVAITDDSVLRLFLNFVCFPIDGSCRTVHALPLSCLYRLAPCFIYVCTWTSLIGCPSVNRADCQTAVTNIRTFDVVSSHRFHSRCDPLQDIAIATRAHIVATSFIDLSFAISRSCSVLDRLSPLSVLTVEFPVHRQVRSALILASAVSI